MIVVRWDKPGSRHHNVVHYVSKDLLHQVPDSNRVIVMWPRKGKKDPERWEAVLETSKVIKSTTPASKLHIFEIFFQQYCKVLCHTLSPCSRTLYVNSLCPFLRPICNSIQMISSSMWHGTRHANVYHKHTFIAYFILYYRIAEKTKAAATKGQEAT